jgi:hypothetical protein
MLLRAESVSNEGRRAHLSEVVSPCLAKISEEVCRPERTMGEKRDPASKPAATEAAVAGGATNAHRANLCVCGSGLRSPRCCELDPAFAATPEAMERVAILGNCALHAFANGDFAAAEARTLEVLDTAPRFPAGLWILYLVRRRAGQEHDWWRLRPIMSKRLRSWRCFCSSGVTWSAQSITHEMQSVWRRFICSLTN